MVHADQARRRALGFLSAYLKDKTDAWRVLLIDDLLYRLRLILWCPPGGWEAARADIDDSLQDAAAPYWSRDVLRGCGKMDCPDGPWQNDAWEQADATQETNRLRIMDRQRTKEGWFQAPGSPPWSMAKENPSIVAFYSFKGGVGRSTALAATALHVAAAGERVAVLDFDLDAPGVGLLLAGHDGATAPWGISDYLLERPLTADGTLDLADYFHRCPASLFAGAGEVTVFPAGAADRRYVTKLARLDYGPPPSGQTHPFIQLLQDVREKLRPHWILIDARAGLGNMSGFVMGGLCHVHVLAGTLADASWRGLAMILDRLGADRVLAGQPQAECVLAAAMMPRQQEGQYRESVSLFTDRARDVFSAHYYSNPDHGDDYWTVEDVESTDAPHVPVALPYDVRLALFRDLYEVAGDVLLTEAPYQELVERVRASRQRMIGSRR